MGAGLNAAAEIQQLVSDLVQVATSLFPGNRRLVERCGAELVFDPATVRCEVD